MTAKYAGKCCDCSKPIEVGQPIRFFGRGRASHQNCYNRDGLTENEQAAKIVAPCWICKAPDGRFRNLGAATPVWCDACFAAEQAKTKTIGNVRFNPREDYPCSDMGYEDACRDACGPGL